MIPSVMKEKLLKIAQMLWVSPETISKIDSEVSSGTEWKTIVVMKKDESVPTDESKKDSMPEDKKDLCEMSPEEIDKLDEKVLKDMVKKHILDMKKEDMDEEKPSLQSEMNKTSSGWMY